MIISDLRFKIEDGFAKLSAEIYSDSLGTNELWFATPDKYAKHVCTSRLDGFMVGMLFPAMQCGEDIHIEGCVSKKLLFNLNNYAIPLLLDFSPSSKIIKITAAQTSTDNFDGSGVGTGFSGGVDSFCTIYDRYAMESDPSYKINTFLFLNVGSHGYIDMEKAERKFWSRYAYLEAFPDELQCPFIPLNSNLHVFHPWGHQKTHTLTSAAGVLVLQHALSKYYYASAVGYHDMLSASERFREMDIGEYCDPILWPLLSTETLTFIFDGGQYTRSQKTRRIINYEPTYRYLNVCVKQSGTYENCSACSKCCRTLMTLNSLNKLDLYAHIFDVAKYKRSSEHQYTCQQVLREPYDVFAKDNVQLARQHGCKLPSKPYSRVYLAIMRTIKLIRLYAIRSLSCALPKSLKAWIQKTRKTEHASR